MLIRRPLSWQYETIRHRRTIDDVALDTLKQVFHFLDAASLCASAQVCSLWRDVTNDDTYWVDLCKVQYNICPKTFTPPPDPVKLLYMLQYG
jgi:hypothetical protein